MLEQIQLVKVDYYKYIQIRRDLKQVITTKIFIQYLSLQRYQGKFIKTKTQKKSTLT